MSSYRLLLLLVLICASGSRAVEILTLEDTLAEVIAAHPEVGAAKANLEVEKASVNFSQWPGDPMFGVMYEKNMNMMQQQMGAMTSLSVSQDIEFPAKYYFRGQLQGSRSSQAMESLIQTRLSLRRKVITTYFQLYVNQKIEELMEAQKSTVRQVARIAESRHAIGAVTQQDEMKAHVEQTLVENELLEVRREGEALQAKMASLLGYESDKKFALPSGDLPVPDARITSPMTDLIVGGARPIKQDEMSLEQARLQKTLAFLEYAPNFRLSARTMVGANRPDNNFAFTIDLSLPIWFFMRQNSEVSTASARVREAQYTLEKTKRALVSEAQEIATKVRTHADLIKVFSTTLVPQAESSLNASLAAYRAGRTSFLELLDSARTVLTIHAAYYRHIAEYVEQLVLLEELTGKSLSSLPFGECT